MKCTKCGSENDDSSKFCGSCGEPLNKPIKSDRNMNKDKKIIIALLIVIIVILALGVLYGIGAFKGEVPLETKDFGGFEMDVPAGSKYVLNDEYSKDGKFMVGYKNKGEYKLDALGFYVGNNLPKIKNNDVYGQLCKKNGTLDIYKNETPDGVVYSLYQENDKTQLMMVGNNMEVLEKMAQSFKETDLNRFTS